MLFSNRECTQEEHAGHRPKLLQVEESPYAITETFLICAKNVSKLNSSRDSVLKIVQNANYVITCFEIVPDNSRALLTNQVSSKLAPS